MDTQFPILRNKAGSLVVLYSTTAGGERPYHGAYLARQHDTNVWIPCAWTEDGYMREKDKPTDLDIVEAVTKWKEKKIAETEEVEQTTTL